MYVATSDDADQSGMPRRSVAKSILQQIRAASGTAGPAPSVEHASRSRILSKGRQRIGQRLLELGIISL